ncbi:MAG TPA: transporter substrate-binding domain-containing protein [Burkholderiales bacterium]|nr:transporter substrate-binding domain-containing protein [Burkholderiales bacterium]
MVRLIVLLATVLLSAPARGDELKLLAAELPPYTFQVPSASVSEFPGPGRGVVYDIVQAMAKRVGHTGPIEFTPWRLAQQTAMTEPDIGILALTRTPEREDKYRWIVKILTDDLVLVGGRGVDVSSLEKVKDRPTGVLLRSGAEALLKEKGFTRIEPAPEEWMNARKLRERRIDAWLAPRLMVIYAWREVGGDPLSLDIGAIVRPSEIWFAGSKSLPNAEVEKWQKAFEEIRADGTYERILADYNRLKIVPVPDELRRRDHETIWAY